MCVWILPSVMLSSVSSGGYISGGLFSYRKLFRLVDILEYFIETFYFRKRSEIARCQILREIQ